MESTWFQHDIAVGFDGSDDSLAASAWAVDEAQRAQRRLTLVTVVQPGPQGLDPWVTSAQFLRELGHRTSDPEVARIRREVPDLDVRAVVHVGSPRVELARAARAARTVVLGLRGRHHLGRVVSGSVTEHLLRATSTTVALVPSLGAGGGPELAGSARVLALVGPRSTGHAVDAALAEGRLRGGEVSLVRATRTPSGALVADQGARVSAAYARTVEGHPGPPLPLRIHSGTAADFLRDEPLTPTDLVVLGRHHHGPGAELFVDGTLQELLQRPRCVVLVVDDDPGGEAAEPVSDQPALRPVPVTP